MLAGLLPPGACHCGYKATGFVEEQAAEGEEGLVKVTFNVGDAVASKCVSSVVSCYGV